MSTRPPLPGAPPLDAALAAVTLVDPALQPKNACTRRGDAAAPKDLGEENLAVTLAPDCLGDVPGGHVYAETQQSIWMCASFTAPPSSKMTARLGWLCVPITPDRCTELLELEGARPWWEHPGQHSSAVLLLSSRIRGVHLGTDLFWSNLRKSVPRSAPPPIR